MTAYIDKCNLNRTRIGTALLYAVGLMGLAAACNRTQSCSDVEKAHGLRLPSSARNCQTVRAKGMVDHGVLSMFELDQKDLMLFTNQLTVKSTQLPTRQLNGDPCINGWNVWPTNSQTFVPGNRDLSYLVKTWTGEARPIQSLSCRSTKGDWLHVEIWNVENHSLVKVYTDWN